MKKESKSPASRKPDLEKLAKPKHVTQPIRNENKSKS